MAEFTGDLEDLVGDYPQKKYDELCYGEDAWCKFENEEGELIPWKWGYRACFSDGTEVTYTKRSGTWRVRWKTVDSGSMSRHAFKRRFGKLYERAVEAVVCLMIEED